MMLLLVIIIIIITIINADVYGGIIMHKTLQGHLTDNLTEIIDDFYQCFFRRRWRKQKFSLTKIN